MKYQIIDLHVESTSVGTVRVKEFICMNAFTNNGIPPETYSKKIKNDHIQNKN